MLWMYHQTKPDGHLFASVEDVPAGWVDSPAALDDVEVKIDLADMTHDQLKDYIAEHELDVDRRLGREKMIAAITEILADGDGS